MKGFVVMRMLEYLECGKIVNTHGVKGTVKVESWCDTPEELIKLKRVFINKNGAYCEYPVIHASVQKSMGLLLLDGIHSLEDAMEYKGTVIYAAREDLELEEGRYFIADLIGLKVADIADEKVYGVIKDVINNGASDIYVVDVGGNDRMMPAVDEFVERIDLDNETVFVKPIPGMLEDIEG